MTAEADIAELRAILNAELAVRDWARRAGFTASSGIHIHNLSREVYDAIPGTESELSTSWSKHPEGDDGAVLFTNEPPRVGPLGEGACPHCRGQPRRASGGVEYVCAWCLGDGECDAPDCEHNQDAVRGTAEQAVPGVSA